jgi:hypothetical protein
MSVLQLTTLSVNGQHLTVPLPAQPRTQWMRSRLAASGSTSAEGTGMAERGIC